VDYSGGSFARRAANIDSHSFIYVCACVAWSAATPSPCCRSLVAARHAPDIPANEKRLAERGII
jgi:hypothetical protein